MLVREDPSLEVKNDADTGVHATAPGSAGVTLATLFGRSNTTERDGRAAH